MTRVNTSISLAALLSMLTYVGIAGACAALPSTESAAETKPDPLAIYVSLATDSPVMVGQAIILHDSIQATASAGIVATPLDPDSDLWYTLSLTDAGGKSVQSLPKRQHFQRRGVYSPPNPFFHTGSVREGYIVVNQVFDIKAAGEYRLTIHVNMPYKAPEKWNDAVDSLPSANDTQGTVIRKEIEIPFKIIVPDPNALHRAADHLRQRFMDSPYPSDREFILQCLCAMPEDFAADSWRLIALYSNYNTPEGRKIARALAETRTLEAVEILIQMHFKHTFNDPTLNTDSPLLFVKRMREVATPEMQKQIDQLLGRYHVDLKVPDPGD